MKTRSILATLALAIALKADSGAGLKWTAPATWKSEGSRPMRLVSYSIPAVPGDSNGAECGVYYFGQGQGGSVADNIARWIGQFRQPNGKSSNDAAKVDHRTTRGIKVSTVDISGGYTGMGGPMAPAGPPKAGYRMLGAVVEGPQGSVFFKLVGPAKTVGQNQAAFDKMLATLSPQ